MPRLFAQLPASCNGTVSAIACDITCISCNFNGFAGSTEGYPSGVAPEFCGTVENVQWLGFIAGATQATFTITPVNCVNGDGVQVALYNDCQAPPLDCDKGEMGGGMMPVSISVPMVLGGAYYLLVDGYAGDQCQFTVSVSPADAVFQPPLAVVQTITGTAAMCPNTTANFQVQPVSGASAYIWTGPPGTLFDSLPSPATILGTGGLEVAVTIGSQSGPICVQAANPCEVNPPCSASIDVTVLDDTARPKILADTLVSLPCGSGPIPLTVLVDPPNNISFAWSLTDSIGSIVGGVNVLNLKIDSIGQYTLLATDRATGCTSTLDIRVTEPVLPTDAEIDIKNVTCYDLKNGEIRIGNISDGTSPFLFSLDDAPLSSITTMIQLPAGAHKLLIQDAVGCEWDTVIQINQPDELLVRLDPDTSIALGDALWLWDSLNVSDVGRVTRWVLQLGDIGDSIRCARCPVMPIRSFNYDLEVIDSSGCAAKDTRTVLVSAVRNVYIPNVFKPSGDDSGNTRFGPFCGDDVVRIKRFQVFDRWGNLVHNRIDLSPDDQNLFWEGKIGSKWASPDVFVCEVEVLFKDMETIVYKSSITLIR